MKHHSVICRSQKTTLCNFKSADAFKDNNHSGHGAELVDVFGGGVRLAVVSPGLWASWPVPPPPVPKGVLCRDQLVSNNS